MPRLVCTLSLFGPLQVGLPSPSQITWPQVNRILIGRVSRNIDDLMKLVGQFPSPQGEIIAAIEQECMFMDRFYDNTTEMEAMARVLSIINITFRQVEPKIRVRLQLSITRHPVFTDVLMFINDDAPCVLMEVKNVGVHCELTSITKPTAQVLRLMHILLVEESYSVSQLPLLHTNYFVWLFGLARKTGNKVEVTSTVTLLQRSDDFSSRVVHFRVAPL